MIVDWRDGSAVKRTHIYRDFNFRSQQLIAAYKSSSQWSNAVCHPPWVPIHMSTNTQSHIKKCYILPTKSHSKYSNRVFLTREKQFQAILKIRRWKTPNSAAPCQTHANALVVISVILSPCVPLLSRLGVKSEASTETFREHTIFLASPISGDYTAQHRLHLCTLFTGNSRASGQESDAVTCCLASVALGKSIVSLGVSITFEFCICDKPALWTTPSSDISLGSNLSLLDHRCGGLWGPLPLKPRKRFSRRHSRAENPYSIFSSLVTFCPSECACSQAVAFGIGDQL